MANEKSKTTFSLQLQHRNLHLSCKIYECKCSCGETYIGETIRSVEERRSEHNSSENKSEPTKHLADNKEHLADNKEHLADDEEHSF